MKACKMFIFLALLTGLIYPLVMTAIGQLFMPYQAKGSLLVQEHQIIGSKCIGQSFTSEQYFWSRPSATDYNPLPSSGSHLGPTSALLQHLVQQRRDRLGAQDVPSDLLFSSASGLDPHITSEAAYFQIPRVAQARHLDSVQITQKVQQHLHKTWLGPPYINVLMLNLDLDQLMPTVSPQEIESRKK